MKKERSNNVVGGLIWTFAERISAQLVSTIVGIVLARLLTPDDYGVISIVMVFITFCDVFVTAGLGSAIVQKKEVDSVDYNTAFLLSFSMAAALYAVLFLAAPWIAEIYEMPVLRSVIRVLGIRLIITSVNTIQQAGIRRQMQFRRFFVSTIWGTVASCVVGVAMAYMGYGVWALVAQYLVNALIGTVVLHFIGEWKPRLQFSVQKAKEMYSFGVKVLGSQLISTMSNDIRSLIVGKVFGSAELAYFDNGKKYPALIVVNVNSSLKKVMLPVFARKRENLDVLKATLRKSIQLGFFIMAPLLLGLFSVADTFVRVVLTEKWLDIIPFLQLFCIIYLTRPIEELCHQTVLALGRSDLSLKILTTINVVSLIMVFIAVFVFESVLYVAIFSLLNAVVGTACFLLATNRLIGYTIREQMSDMLPSLFIALAMSVGVSFVNLFPLNDVALLLAQIIAGGCLYLLLSCVCRLKVLSYIWSRFSSCMKKKQKAPGNTNK